MAINTDSPGETERIAVLDLPAFLRLFERRGPQIMWLLGAGASRSAGVKTAWDMIWDFKARLYRSHKKSPPSATADLGDFRTRAALQRFFDELGGFPPENSEEEYAAYFEATYPSPRDRRAYIQEMAESAKPSFGHAALATLFELKLTDIVWTTNFDRLVEDSAVKAFGTTARLVVADITDPERLRQAISESRWPAYGKLHGDFQSDALKNTTKELQNQDASMRRLLVNACKVRGLAIVGYSGRDASVMEALAEAIDGGAGFPGGLYWFVRSTEPPYAAAEELILTAREAGVEAAFVQVESFDELFSDLLHYLPQTASRAIALRDDTMPRRSKFALPERKARKPFIRTNAVPVTSYPKVCWLVDCRIGGWDEIQDALAKAGSDILATRIRAGVIAFGDNAELKRCFSEFDIKNISTHGIVPERLNHETGERTLLRMALLRGIERLAGISIERRGPRATVVAPQDTSRNIDSLTRAVGKLTGVIANTSIKWSEACDLRLEYRLDGLWLLFEPTIRVEMAEDISDEDRNLVKEFVRERRAQRFNKQANAILDGWTNLVFPKKADAVLLTSVDGKGGIGASFELTPVTAFSGLHS